MGAAFVCIVRWWTAFGFTTEGPFRAKPPSADQAVCSLQARDRLEEEVGAGLGAREVLLKEVRGGSQDGRPRVEATGYDP